ncbi:outer membrane protein [Bradyrhizobium sp. CCGUVB14]|uniref:outer membrane protein n=1 Tax=Bradyrhizobium sp. CCGUVB14 TaxID=2949628 RepID=UPI0020B2322F|nr:outer membrane beta-barrel protein [Bradyrhizobium sp. CCGUVB14]MCP3443317.1 outer membrane beta-barrel protein [Bradyrhizobium sp. CCGUVB14]
MKKLLLTTASLCAIGLATPALAADLPIYGKAPAAVSPVYDWSGFYVGVFGGGGYGNHNLNNATGPAGFANFTANYDSKGGLGGGEIGYQWQSGQIVFGVEADAFGADIKGSDSFALGWDDATKLGWGGTLRARGGIAVDRLLLFFTGGWAYGELTHTNTNPGFGVDTFKATRSGLAAGGGIAYAITDNLIGKFEYRYLDLGTFHRDAPTNGALPYTVANTYSVVTLGLDFKFGGNPVVAKY